MSFQHNFLLTRVIDAPWKTFVKESCSGTEILENRVHQLGFQGSEAKTAYEEVINQESNIQVAKHKHHKQRALVVQNSSVCKTHSSNVKYKKTHLTEDVRSKVTINTILKAVEQKDLIFLLKHITQENVNLSDEFGWTPLMSAAYCGHFEIVQFLLKIGANRKVRERSGLTAAQLALKKNHLYIVALLKKRTECTNSKSSSESNTDTVGTELTNPLKNSNISANRHADLTKDQLADGRGFYCEICEANFYETSQKKHESSTLHIFNTKPKLPTIYGISKQNKGYQMLLNTGWDEQDGLGPSGKGIKYPIKTCLKTDRKGLGQSGEKEFRVTHFKPGDTNAINNLKIFKQKCLKKGDREKLLNKEARKERALRIALS